VDAEGFSRIAREVEVDRDDVTLPDFDLSPVQPLDLLVRDSRTGEPVAHAPIDLGGDGRAMATDAAGRSRLTLRSDPTTLVIRDRRYAVATRTVRSADTSLVISLDPGAQITGTVLDASGAPHRNALVYALEGPLVRYTVPDDHGRYVLSGFGPGEYQVRVRLEDEAYLRSVASDMDARLEPRLATETAAYETPVTLSAGSAATANFVVDR
jgi:hypothetical protein